MHELLFGHPLLRELERMQRDLSQGYGGSSSVRASRPGSFPAINVGTTEKSIEIVAFVPGIDAKTIELTVDRGMLVLAGARNSPVLAEDAKAHMVERFSGNFRRVVELPDSADPNTIEARYHNGCLKISVAKKEASTPKQISIQ